MKSLELLKQAFFCFTGNSLFKKINGWILIQFVATILQKISFLIFGICKKSFPLLLPDITLIDIFFFLIINSLNKIIQCKRKKIGKKKLILETL